MRPIDADALIKSIEKSRGKNSIYAQFVRAWAKDTPTIDAVSVVRCKDCVSFRYSGMGGDNGILYCAKLLTEMQPTDFCSYGERKDDETN